MKIAIKVCAAATVLVCLSACGDGNGDASQAANHGDEPPTDNVAAPSSVSRDPAGTVGQVTVNAAERLGPITRNQVGANLGVWYDTSRTGVSDTIKATGARLLHWPGGTISDNYHWQTNSLCKNSYGAADFDRFMDDVAIPIQAEVALTVNYGTNATCDGGGDPAEAAAWVEHVVNKGYNVHHYTVGNEVWGDWSPDLHATPHDAATYAAAVGTSSSGGYYQQMKTMDPTAQVGVVVMNNPAWDSVVLNQADYDFVEYHWYAQAPGSESDTRLLMDAPDNLRQAIASLRTELAGAGKPSDFPIFLGEVNSVFGSPGKQTMSVVNGLFTGMAYGELLEASVPMTAWFMGIGLECFPGNTDDGLYGWQGAGTYSQVSNGYAAGTCGSGSPAIPFGTVFPSGRAQQLVSRFAVPGSQMLETTVASTLTDVRAYGATRETGYALMLFNLDKNVGKEVTVGIANTARRRFTATAITYGKRQYDDSRYHIWTEPVTRALGEVQAPMIISLPAWSMTVLMLE